MRSPVLALVAVLGVLAVAAPAQAVSDELWGDQWSLGTSGLDVTRLWPHGRGAGVVVAVLDSGIDGGHPDLRGALWSNPREIPANGLDDDRSGVVDDVHGADLVDDDGDPLAPERHGTAEAGVVAARAGDGIGIAGVAPLAEVLSVRVLGADSRGRLDTVAKGVRYALDRGARILLLALSSDGNSRELERALEQAHAAGAVVVAAAGNAGRDIDLIPEYPASLPSPAVLGVGASDRDGSRAPFSNHGETAVDLWAPGVDITAPTPGGDWHVEYGTSSASAHVAGALALLSSVRPDLPVAQLAATLRATARPGRRIDLPAAMADLGVVTAPETRLRVGVRTGRTGRTAIRVALSPALPAAFAAEVNGRPVTVAGGRTLLRLRPGRHHVRVVARDAAGSVLSEATRTFRVARRGCRQSRSSARRRSRAARTCRARAGTSKGFSRKSARSSRRSPRASSRS